MQDTLQACKMDVDEASADNEEEEDGVWHYNELLIELELREVSILRHIALKKADPIQLREKVRHLGRTAKVEGSDKNARHQ